ncbi:DUF6382 domain-containing protein [Phosphitispora sp. TUW77]|uniref:DUF6382 domain-containing protein n=1 Tax=Phosphitispora sp. TUW77 TaxID=3152361 RepID=UPI003AB89F6E
MKVTGVLYGFKTEYKVDSGKNYLIISKEGLVSADILAFQVEMLANNKIPGIVQIQLREKNAELGIYYNLTGLLSLRNYLKRQCICKVEFIELLEGIVSIVSDSCRYFLDSGSFIFNEDFVFLNPLTKEIFLIYIPTLIHQDIGQSFKAMVVNTLICSANIDTADNFVQKLLKLFDSGEFNQGEFNCGEFCRRLKTISIEDEAGSSGTVGNGVFCELQPLDIDVKLKSEGKNSKIMILAGLAVIVVTGAVLSNIYNCIGGLGDMFAGLQLTGYLPAGAAVLLAAGCAVVWLVKSGKKAGRKPEEDTARSHESLQRFVTELNMSESKEKSHQVPNVPNLPNLPDATDGVSLMEETVLLGEANYPFLMAVNGDETIVIDKPEFIIGRNEGACDYAISDRSIGRAHARINNKDNVFYIMDMDSKNGTLINNIRIMSSQQYELKHNDRVAFANMEYCFRVK